LLKQLERLSHGDLLAEALIAWARDDDSNAELSRLGALALEVGSLSYPTLGNLETKLTSYSLSPTHSVGKHKAAVFRESLGIEVQDWRLLAFQLVDGLLRSGPTRTRGRFVDESGESLVQYHTNIRVQGLNGRTDVVQAGWKVDSEMRVNLTTALVKSSVGREPIIERESPIPFHEVTDRGQWQSIWNSARNYADNFADRYWVPPLAPSGEELVSEIDRVFVSLTVSTRHTDFLNWLVQGRLNWSAVSESIEIEVPSCARLRALPWADAAARALELNGISSVVTFWQPGR
jgi:hypothetical protein